MIPLYGGLIKTHLSKQSCRNIIHIPKAILTINKIKSAFYAHATHYIDFKNSKKKKPLTKESLKTHKTRIEI